MSTLQGQFASRLRNFELTADDTEESVLGKIKAEFRALNITTSPEESLDFITSRVKDTNEQKGDDETKETMPDDVSNYYGDEDTFELRGEDGAQARVKITGVDYYPGSADDDDYVYQINVTMD